MQTSLLSLLLLQAPRCVLRFIVASLLTMNVNRMSWQSKVQHSVDIRPVSNDERKSSHMVGSRVWESSCS